MRKLISIIVFIPLFAAAQKKGSSEFNAWFGTHLYNQKKDVYSSFGQPIIDIKNTIGNSLAGDYRRITNYNLILLGGLEIGYEHFSGEINYPFETYGFARPKELGKQYFLKATTVYGRANLGVGYRLKIKKHSYDIVVGNMMQTPITYKRKYYVSLETLKFGGDNYNFHQTAYFGKDYGTDFIVDNISFLQLSTKFELTQQHVLNLGIRVQKSLFFPYASLNFVGIEYFNDKGSLVGRDVYYDDQFAVSLMLGYTF